MSIAHTMFAYPLFIFLLSSLIAADFSEIYSKIRIVKWMVLHNNENNYAVA